MRFLLSFALLALCLAIIPSVNCDRKYKVSEYDERDRRDTKERYSKREDGKYKKYKKDGHSNEDLSESKSDKVRRVRREKDDSEDIRSTRRTNRNGEDRVKRIKTRIIESDEDYTDETDEVDVSVCVDKRGGRCETDELTDETEEDYSDEDQSNLNKKKRVIYIKKFPHEKKKQKLDKETGSILKMHKRGGSRRTGDDEVSSEELGVPKRRRFVLEEDDE